jgi:hypothetical protein
MKGLKTWWTLVIVLAALWACDPCNDCRPAVYEPTVELILINGDSLNKVNDSLEVANALITLVDQLAAIQARITNGETDLEDDLAAKEAEIDALTHLRELVPNLRTYLTTNRTQLTAIRNLILSGKVWVEEILAEEWLGTLQYEDSLTRYNIPLVYQAESMEVALYMTEQWYSLALSYQSLPQPDADRRVLSRARNIVVTGHSFDSIRVECRTGQCYDRETTITAYF